jgi:hypothetical protein
MFCCPHCSQLSTILNNIVTPDSGSTILFNIVDKCEQRWQQNIVQACFQQHCYRLAFFAVYTCSIKGKYPMLQVLYTGPLGRSILLFTLCGPLQRAYIAYQFHSKALT